MVSGERPRLDPVHRFPCVPNWPRNDHLDRSRSLHDQHNGMKPSPGTRKYVWTDETFQFLGTAFLHRRVTLVDLMKSWFVSFFGNLAGMLFFMAVITGCTSVFVANGAQANLLILRLGIDGGWLSEPAYKAETIKFAHMKMVTPAWHQIFLRAIGGEDLIDVPPLCAAATC